MLNIRGNWDLKMILNDNNIALDTEEDFKETYNDTTNEEFSFLKINIENCDKKVLSKGFDKFYEISDLFE